MRTGCPGTSMSEREQAEWQQKRARILIEIGEPAPRNRRGKVGREAGRVPQLGG